VRGDFFWGSGPQAEAKAGPMKAEGQYWFLLPK
jgi:membrane-bound lytic murein transglycosylase A